MSFLSAVSVCLRKYTTFSGRATRSEFWYWTLAQFLLAILTAVLDQVFKLQIAPEVGLLSVIVSLLTFLPSLAVSARRLHDLDRSGWWMLISFTVIGLFVLIYWYCCRGTEGRNRFDPPAQPSEKPRIRVPAASDPQQ